MTGFLFAPGAERKSRAVNTNGELAPSRLGPLLIKRLSLNP